MRYSILAILAALFMLSIYTSVGLAEDNSLRTWTSAKGKYTVEATLIELDADVVRLRKADGREITVPLAKLSKPDREYTRKHGQLLDDKELSVKEVKTTNTETQAIAQIKKLGGRYEVDNQIPGKPVIKMVLFNNKITDAGLERLKGLTSLQRLFLGNTQITDAGLVHLKGLTSLRGLFLDNTQITDAGLMHLKGLTSLQELNLGNTQITDAGLEHFKGMTSLQRLHLANTPITDDGIKKLKEALPKCTIAR